MSNIEKLVRKIIQGDSDVSKEDIQIYVNYSEEIERRLKEELEILQHSRVAQ